jgi:diguanylate cyclase (GGDEF)-like protein/PAS domain S-box-containing protein
MFDLIITLSITVIAAALATFAIMRFWFRWSTRQAESHAPALRMALDMSREALVACRNERILHINSAGLRLLGETAATAIGQPITNYIHPDYQVLCAGSFEALLDEDAATPAKLVQSTGRVLDIQIAAWRSTEESSDIFVSLRDISDLMRANHNVAAQLKRLNSILDTALDAIIVSDQSGHVETFNNAASAMFRYEPREVLGKPLSMLFVDPLVARTTSSMALTARRKDGSIFPAEISLSACQLDDRLLSTALIRDVTERRMIENHLAHAATHDALTSLPNRNLLLERLQAAIAGSARSGKILALWFFDLNGIKTVNDVMGHAAGDQLLIAVGQRMTEMTGTDGVVARFGGDEFAVIANGFAAEADVGPAVAAFLRQLSRPFTLLGREVTVTANVGIAVYPKHSGSASELLLDASAAMMFSKVAGRNQFRFFDPIMHRQSEERLTLESELRRGIDRDELLLHYQPQVDVRTGRIVGLEALVRWKHPARGMVLPGQFIPIAEQTGLIGPLGEWVLRRACMDLKRLENMGIGNVRVGVNMSPRQFDSDVVGAVRSALVDTGVTPHLLDVEITESTLIDDPDRVIGHLLDLKALGVHISLDDFGTGFSSLSYLKRFPADTLKVDRSFVTELAENPKDEAIAATIITLAHSMGMTALAEGVEELAQYDVLREADCDFVQGYLFSAAMSFDDVTVHLQRNTPLLPEEGKEVTLGATTR